MDAYFCLVTKHEYYMNRCLQLAKLGAGKVAPNPMVGAVLLHNGLIIGEGYHEQYGGPHAEVNCINSVAEQNKELIAASTLYVSLEPCAHFGKTPPCADLIIKNKIPHVVIACRDAFIKVNGHGIEKLKEAGIEVTEGILEKEAMQLNKRFFCFHKNKRPYIILKWAQSNDGFIAGPAYKQIAISNDYTNRFTHRLRSYEAAIIVGTNTAIYDNPSLTARWWPGKNPLRIIIDKQLRLPLDAEIFKDTSPIIILNNIKEEKQENIYFHKIAKSENMLNALLKLLYENNINSLIAEGGTFTLQSFINEGLWDEAIVITNSGLNITNGIAAPVLTNKILMESFTIFSDQVQVYKATAQ